jgi:pimeloyl-ACP methyl ester carboxylesterase
MKETLILIPGFANDGLAWKYQIQHLQDLFEIKVIVMDTQATRQEMVASLFKEAPHRFLLAGHSMGGWIAQAAASLFPERISKLILLNTWATPDPKVIYLQREIREAIKQGYLMEAMQQHLGLLLHPTRLHDAALIESLQKMMLNFSPQALVRQLEAMLEDYSSLHLHSAIAAPTLIVHSQDDALFSAKEPQAMATGIRDSQLAIIEETGHASTLEQPEKITSLIRSFATLSAL